jgi:hypothetical protein
MRLVTVDACEEECQWVFRIPTEVWDDAKIETVAVDNMIPAQYAVTISGMADVAEMHENSYIPNDTVKLIRVGEDSYMIRDGHHRWLYSLLLGRKVMSAQVIDMKERYVN